MARKVKSVYHELFYFSYCYFIHLPMGLQRTTWALWNEAGLGINLSRTKPDFFNLKGTLWPKRVKSEYHELF